MLSLPQYLIASGFADVVYFVMPSLTQYQRFLYFWLRLLINMRQDLLAKLMIEAEVF